MIDYSFLHQIFKVDSSWISSFRSCLNNILQTLRNRRFSLYTLRNTIPHLSESSTIASDTFLREKRKSLFQTDQSGDRQLYFGLPNSLQKTAPPSSLCAWMNWLALSLSCLSSSNTSRNKIRKKIMKLCKNFVFLIEVWALPLGLVAKVFFFSSSFSSFLIFWVLADNYIRHRLIFSSTLIYLSFGANVEYAGEGSQTLSPALHPDNSSRKHERTLWNLKNNLTHNLKISDLTDHRICVHLAHIIPGKTAEEGKKVSQFFSYSRLTPACEKNVF